MKKLIAGVLVVSIIAGFLFWRFGPFSGGGGTANTGPIKLTYFGLWEDDTTLKPAIEAFQKTHPNITINYVKQSSLNYRTRVQTQIRASQGPDIFRLHNSWIPMFIPDLYPAPAEVFGLTDYTKTFFPVAKDSLVVGGKILAAPMTVDGLALFVNEEMLATAGVTPPTNWPDFISSAVKMTVRDPQGQLQTAGAAMGSPGNVDHWPEILSLLFFQQPQADLANPASIEGGEAIKFFTSFITDPTKKTWDVNLPSSTMMFQQGRLAYYFAPSWRAIEIKAANPNLKFRTVPVPQLPGKNVALGTFWVEGVSIRSAHPKEAWEFLKFLTSLEAERLMYTEAAKTRILGEPYSRVDLASQLLGDPYAGAFVAQGPIYKSWYLNSRTFDAGLNDEMIKYYEDAVNSVLQGNDPVGALSTASQGVTQVLDKYTKPAAPIKPAQ